MHSIATNRTFKLPSISLVSVNDETPSMVEDIESNNLNSSCNNSTNNTDTNNVNGNGNAGNFVGLVDELSLWDRAFSNDDVHSLMNLSLSGEEESLLGYWNFDEESYPIVYDQSSYENHAENINGAELEEQIKSESKQMIDSREGCPNI